MSSQADLTEVALRLRAISRDDGSIDAAQVRLIGLDQIREAAGANWPRMRERVRAGSLSILSRHSMVEDVIIPAGDGFLVILAEGAPGNNQDRCRRMSDALLAFYLGEEALSTLRPDVRAHSLSADGFADLVAATLQREPASSMAPAPRDDIAQARVFATKEGQVVARWSCPVLQEGCGRRLAYEPEFFLDGIHRKRNFLALDLSILEHASAHCLQEQDRLAVGFSVHASTMQLRRHREVFLAAVTNAPPAFRRRATITIAEIEKGTPLVSIVDWCSALRTAFPRVCLDFHYTDHALSSIGSTGAWAAGFHLPIYSGAQRGPRMARTLDQLRFWSKTVHAQGMRLAVNGFREPDFVREASAADVDIATSDVLWPFQTDVLQAPGAAA